LSGIDWLLNKVKKVRSRLSLGKMLWLLFVILLMVGTYYVFNRDRYVGASQDFGPVEVSGSGGRSPFNVTLRLQCGSEDNSYLSDVADINCEILTRSKAEPIPEMDFRVLIMNARNQTVVECNSAVENISNVSESSSFCLNSMGNRYFELPTGDFRVVIKQFSIMGGGVVVTKANPVMFRGELHVISAFEKQTRLSQDGTSLATFLAFLFIIPTTVFALRSFLMESTGKNRTEDSPEDSNPNKARYCFE